MGLGRVIFLERFSPWRVSLLLHGAVAGLAIVSMALLTGGKTSESSKIEVTILAPTVSPSAAPLPVQKIQSSPAPVPPAKPAKQVFGVSRSALTSSESGVTVKAGNTLAKQADNETLKPIDADSIPVPRDEYLITRMPKIRRETRIAYPKEARAAEVQGNVVVELLIDSLGKVRNVKLISGPGYGLNEAAVAALQSFEFEPAEIASEKVAVQIRYTYKFVLEKE